MAGVMVRSKMKVLWFKVKFDFIEVCVRKKIKVRIRVGLTI